MRSRIEDVLNVLRTIRAENDRDAPRSPDVAKFGRNRTRVERELSLNVDAATVLRKKAVRLVADRERADGRFANEDSAQKSIKDACSRRLGRLTTREFDRVVAAWLSGNPEQLHSVLRHVVGYADHR